MDMYMTGENYLEGGIYVMAANFTVFDSFLVSVICMLVVFVLLGFFYVVTSVLPMICQQFESKSNE